MADFNFPNLTRVIGEYADLVAYQYKQNLAKSGRRATGGLIDSVSTKLSIGGVIYAVDLNLSKAWEYVEWDTRPHWPPSGSLLEWIRAKPILPSPNENGRIPTEEQLDFLIRRKIAREGTKGSHDLERTIEEVNEVYMQKIEDALAEDVANATDAEIRFFIGI